MENNTKQDSVRSILEIVPNLSAYQNIFDEIPEIFFREIVNKFMEKDFMQKELETKLVMSQERNLEGFVSQMSSITLDDHLSADKNVSSGNFENKKKSDSPNEIKKKLDFQNETEFINIDGLVNSNYLTSLNISNLYTKEKFDLVELILYYAIESEKLMKLNKIKAERIEKIKTENYAEKNNLHEKKIEKELHETIEIQKITISDLQKQLNFFYTETTPINELEDVYSNIEDLIDSRGKLLMVIKSLNSSKVELENKLRAQTSENNDLHEYYKNKIDIYESEIKRMCEKFNSITENSNNELNKYKKMYLESIEKLKEKNYDINNLRNEVSHFRTEFEIIKIKFENSEHKKIYEKYLFENQENLKNELQKIKIENIFLEKLVEEQKEKIKYLDQEILKALMNDNGSRKATFRNFKQLEFIEEDMNDLLENIQPLIDAIKVLRVEFDKIQKNEKKKSEKINLLEKKLESELKKIAEINAELKNKTEELKEISIKNNDVREKYLINLSEIKYLSDSIKKLKEVNENNEDVIKNLLENNKDNVLRSLAFKSSLNVNKSLNENITVENNCEDEIFQQNLNKKIEELENKFSEKINEFKKILGLEESDGDDFALITNNLAELIESKHKLSEDLEESNRKIKILKNAIIKFKSLRELKK